MSDGEIPHSLFQSFFSIFGKTLTSECSFQACINLEFNLLRSLVRPLFRLDKGRKLTSKERIPRSYKQKKRFAMKRARCKSSTENQDTNATLLKITVKTRSVEGNMGRTSVIRG